MTTTAEIKQILQNYGSEADRVVFAPSSWLSGEHGYDEVAREVVALANRDGGRLILGVDRAGRFEPELDADQATAVEHLKVICEERVVPPIAATLEHLTGEEGEVLVVRVPRRAAAPHACGRADKRGNVQSRAYYVRRHERTRALSDDQLAWMFRVQTDPAVAIDLDLRVQLENGRFAVAGWLPQPRAVTRYEKILEGLDEETRAHVGADADAVQQALVELTSWGVLAEIDDLAAAGAGGIGSQQVSLDDLPVPAHQSVFGVVQGGLRSLLGDESHSGGLLRFLRRRRAAPTVCVPERCDVQIDFLVHQRKGRLTITHPAMILSVATLLGDSGRGLAWEEHAGAQAERTHWVGLRIEVAASLPFPDRTGELIEQAEGFVTELHDRLRARWDTPTFLESIDPAFLRAIVDK